MTTLTEALNGRRDNGHSKFIVRMEHKPIKTLFREQFRSSTYSVRMIASASFVFLAGAVGWTIFTGETSPTVGYPMLALCSSALVGLGMLRVNQINVPVLCGTIVAIGAAGIWLAEVLTSDLAEGTWERATWGLFLAGAFTAVAVISALSNLMMALEKGKHWLWWVVCAGVMALITGAVSWWLIVDGA